MGASRIKAPEPVPAEYAGKWVASTPDGGYVLAAGNTPDEATRAAEARGPMPACNWTPSMGVGLEWVPPADERFIGSDVL